MENNQELEENSQNSSDVEERSTESTEDQTSEKGESTDTVATEEKDQYSDREKQLYERVKRAEAKAKMLEHLEEKTQEVSKDPDVPIQNIAKVVHGLKDYSADEVDTIFRQAKALGVSPLEAAKNEDVDLLIKAKREKVERENKTPEPTNRQSSEGKSFDQWTSGDLEGASLDQIEKYREHLRNKSRR